ncbi:MAG: M10 family metallopeptidase C-terminal domain-containing protein [Kordiimonas sp.]
MTDLTYNWKFYAFNLLFGNWTEGEASGQATYTGNLKGDVSSIQLNANFRANLGSPIGSEVTISYGFVAGPPEDERIEKSAEFATYAEYVTTSMPEHLRAAAKEVFDEISSVVNITFVEAKEGELPNISIFQQVGTGGVGWPLSGPNNATMLSVGEGYASNDTKGEKSSDFALDEWKYIFRHELGHVLGLTHPTEYTDTAWPNTVVDPSSNTIPLSEATIAFTNMSYVGHAQFSDSFENPIFKLHHGVEGDYSVESLGILDIKTLQFLYGANREHSAGDDTYVFRPNNASILSVYDSGGTDTFDLSNQLYGVNVNLEEASFSSIGLVHTEGSQKVLFQNNVGIAWDTVIENAIGTRFGDLISGNNASNMISGKDGDDRLHGIGGNDILVGGKGADYMHGGEGNDAIWAGAGDTSDDYIDGGHGNDTIAGGKGNDELYGDQERGYGFGDDILYGGEGNDTVFGGAGNDTLYGGKGDDLISGQWGEDIMTGGAGADTFLFTSSSAKNTIKDFNVNEDKLDLTAFSITDLVGLASIDQINNQEGILLTLNENTEVFLVGLSLNDISSDIALL